ncbi:MAG: dihydroorotase [Vallitaleaceae bacterium]|nr:dihydroorotase [Vallitaleaceae bacterium]
MNKILIKKGTICTHDKTFFNKDIYIEEGIIKEIGTNLHKEEAQIIDASGLTIVPGFIDLHCNLNDPGYDNKETLYTAGMSAIHGGFTTITTNPNTHPTIDNKAIVEYVLAKSKAECPTNVALYGSLTVGCKGERIAEIGEMYLAGIKAVSDGDLAIQDTGLMRNLMIYSSMFDLPIITHCENTLISNQNMLNEGKISAYLGLLGSPISAETIHLMRNILLAEEYNVRLHIAHVSTAKSVEIIKMFKKQGVRITCETSPQYFTLCEEAAVGYNTFVKVNPPLRTEEDVKAIIKGLQEGIIDAISSDHNPDTIDSKEVEFELASYGISGFETAFPVSYTYLVEQGHLSLEQLIEKMAFKPAQILSLAKGRIQEGLAADLFIFDPNADYIVKAADFKSKARYSPYDGLALNGVIRYTIVNGKVYDMNGQV